MKSPLDVASLKAFCWKSVFPVILIYFRIFNLLANIALSKPMDLFLYGRNLHHERAVFESIAEAYLEPRQTFTMGLFFH